jgi:hypothetical protein
VHRCEGLVVLNLIDVVLGHPFLVAGLRGKGITFAKSLDQRRNMWETALLRLEDAFVLMDSFASFIDQLSNMELLKFGKFR